MDVNFFKPFVDGTKHTLKVQCSVDVKTGKPHFKSDSSSEIKYDIAGVLGLTSNAFSGTLSICFPKTVFLDLMGRMLGEKYSEITDDLADGAAEFLNIIFGLAKVTLNEQGFNLQKAIPTVIRGKDISTRSHSKNPTIVLPFVTDEGTFNLEITKE